MAKQEFVPSFDFFHKAEDDDDLGDQGIAPE